MKSIKKNIYKRGEAYQVKIKVHSRRLARTFRSLEEAERFLEACRNRNFADIQLIAPGSRQGIRPSKIRTIAGLFARVDEKRWSGNPDCKTPGRGSSANALRFIEWVDPKTLVRDALSEATIEAFIKEREQHHGNKGGTINRYVAAISCLAREALKLGLIDRKPDMPRRREGGARMRIFTEAEEAQILNTVRAWGYPDYYHLFCFLADTGCRPGEAQGLVWEDFVTDKIHLEAEITKNSTPRTLTGTLRVMEAVSAMRAKYRTIYPGPFSWADPRMRATYSLWNALRGHLDWMDSKCIIYTFRHTCASRLVQRGIDLYRVQIWMGHKVAAMTQRYAKFAPDHMAQLAAVLERPASDFSAQNIRRI